MDKLVEICEFINDELHLYNRTHFNWTLKLAGACAVGSHILSKTIEKDIPNELVIGVRKLADPGHHAWVETYDGLILDLTAEQYDLQSPNIKPRSHYKRWYRKVHVGTKAYDFWSKWPNGQSNKAHIAFINSTINKARNKWKKL